MDVGSAEAAQRTRPQHLRGQGPKAQHSGALALVRDHPSAWEPTRPHDCLKFGNPTAGIARCWVKARGSDRAWVSAGQRLYHEFTPRLYCLADVVGKTSESS